MIDRRTFLAGAAWVTPTIMTAKPSPASPSAPFAMLSLPPETLPGASGATSHKPAEVPLAFTGDNIEQMTAIGAMLTAGGWAIVHWSARPKETPDA
jgi:hypothetical protein